MRIIKKLGDKMLTKIANGVIGRINKATQSYLYRANSTQDNNACIQRLANTDEFIQNTMKADSNIGGMIIGTGEHNVLYFRKDESLIDYPGKDKEKNPIESHTFFLNRKDNMMKNITAFEHLNDFEQMMKEAKIPQTPYSPAIEKVAQDLQKSSWANNLRRKSSERNGLITPEKGASHKEMLDQLSSSLIRHAKILLDNENTQQNNSGRDFVALKTTGADNRTYVYVFPDFEEEKVLDTLIGQPADVVLDEYSTYLKGKVIDEEQKQSKKLSHDNGGQSHLEMP